MIAILVRSVLLVCFAVLAMRLMGKRQVGQLQPFELVIAIMIADLASSPMESLDTPLWRGVAPLLATVALHQLFTLLSLKSQRMRAFFSGTPTVIIRRGQIDYKALEKLSAIDSSWEVMGLYPDLTDYNAETAPKSAIFDHILDERSGL